MQLFLQLSKLQGTTSYFDENVGRVGVKSDTVTVLVEYGERAIQFSAQVETALLESASK